MAQVTKITFSEDEMELLGRSDFFMLKHSAIEKVMELFAELQKELETLHASSAPVTASGKIFRGDNYRKLPYVVLDYPKHFTADSIFAFRTMFWWGHEFSFTLHLSGHALDHARENIIENISRLKGNEFDKEVIRFDLSAFRLTRTDENLFKDNYQMLNTKQLKLSADSIRRKIAEARASYQNYGMSYYEKTVPNKKHVNTYLQILSQKDSSLKNDFLSSRFDSIFHSGQAKDFTQFFEKNLRPAIVSSALSSARNSKEIANEAAMDIEVKNKSLAKHEIEWHRKFTL